MSDTQNPPPSQNVEAWQPMDTAELTGRKNILLALPHGDVSEGYWGAAHYDRRKRDYVMGWVTSPNSGLVRPIAWQPMPKHPNAALKSEGSADE
ncbi:hypothetical protein [Pararhizobium sp. DWP3-4]|uniref:hypothetical protein n=1 Tax=Pararhizobium sp. DWP3-4 TaxID=2804565 RepID=UPI003CEAA0DB